MATSIVRVTQNSLRCYLRHRQPCVLISQVKHLTTSNNKKEITTTTTETYKTPVTEEQFANPNANENWISFGFDDNDKFYDRLRMYVHGVTGFSVIFGLTFFVISYLPDKKSLNWVSREAYLQLEYREKNGLPLVDPNYAKLDNIALPTEEELEGVEVII